MITPSHVQSSLGDFRGLSAPAVAVRRGYVARALAAAGVPVAIALATFLVLAPALWNDFVNWDDPVNFTNNKHYRGLGWPQLRWMWTAVLMGQWIPLTWMTLGLDYVLWGMSPLGYHLTNLVLHAANASLAYLVARELLSRAGIREARPLVAGAAAAALFFAVHPLRAESVAWVTERRDVLSGFFFLLAALAYLRACDPRIRSNRWRACSIAAYGLAALSKSMVVTLPVLLLVLDVYPLRRLDLAAWRTRRALGLVIEKLPYFALALLAGAMQIYAQIANHFLTPLEKLPLLERIPVALYGIWFYVSKTVVPVGLSPLYELPARIDPLAPRFVASALGAVGLTVLFAALRRRWPAGLAAWVAYLVALAPVSGLLHNGHQLAHDRYSYLPCLPWAMLFGGAVALLVAGGTDYLRPAVARLGIAAAALWLAALAGMTWHQVKVWRDSDTLWRYALEADPDCSICHSNLGASLASRGLYDLAIASFEHSLELRPDRVVTHGNVGAALNNSGRPEEALPHFERVLARHPAHVDTRLNMAVALLRLGRQREAMTHLAIILERDPDHAPALTNLGAAHFDLGEYGRAIELLHRAVEAEPELPQPRFGLVRAYAEAGDTAQAVAQLAELEKIDPNAARVAALYVTPEW